MITFITFVVCQHAMWIRMEMAADQDGDDCQSLAGWLLAAGCWLKSVPAPRSQATYQLGLGVHAVAEMREQFVALFFSHSNCCDM